MIDPEVAGFANVDGGRVWYRVNGLAHKRNGKTPLVIVHGGPGSNHRRLLTLLPFATERVVVHYDQLDCGNSDRPGDVTNWTLKRFASEIESVTRYLSLDSFVLLGHSAGASWAIDYCTSAPSRGLRGIILSSPLISTTKWLEDNRLLIRTLPNEIGAAVEAGERNSNYDSIDYRAAVAEYEKNFYCRNPIAAPDLLADMPPINKALYHHMWGPSEFTATGTLKDLDLSEKLPSISAPVFFICGEWDSARPDTCEFFAQSVRDGQTAIVKDTAHCSYIERPQEYIRSVRLFLESRHL